MSSIPPIGDGPQPEGSYRETIIRDHTPERDEIQRTITPVGRGRFGGSSLGAGAAVAAVVAALVFINLGHHRDDGITNTMAMSPDAAKHPDDRARQTVQMANPTLAAPPPGAPSLTATTTPATHMVTNPDGTVVPAIDATGQPATSGPAAGQTTPAETLAAQARHAPLLVSVGGRSGSSEAAGSASTPGSGAASGTGDGPAAPAAPGELDRLRQVSAIEQSHATVLPNRNYLITAGTLIPCILQTAMNSTQPGYTSCIVPRDVFSDNGRVVLMEKGTKVLGQYQGGMSQGQNRIFVVWTRAVTPRGIAVELASPASDALGRAGMAGAVDTFFWARFGAALMLSLIDDASSIAAAHLANQGSYTTQVPSNSAGIALQNTINIKPVLRKNQGEEVGIFVAKDFNFADVYGLEVKR